MKIAMLRYKGVSWEHNPETLVVTSGRVLANQGLVHSGTLVRDFGEKPRVITGKGQLAGEDCLRRFADLLTLQNQDSSGVLSLPDSKPFFAFFRSLRLDCNPTPELINYSFEFVEDINRRSEPEFERLHVVEPGETLWDIAYKYGISIERLVALNPQIRRVDELREGSGVRIC